VSRVFRYFLLELAVVGVVTGILLVLAPGHPLAAPLAVIVVWVGLQGVSAFSFMRALYRGDVIEHKGPPRCYSPVPRATLNWYTRRFMTLYLKTPAPHPARASTPGVPRP
jgi:hypothetical protein